MASHKIYDADILLDASDILTKVNKCRNVATGVKTFKTQCNLAHIATSPHQVAALLNKWKNKKNIICKVPMSDYNLIISLGAIGFKLIQKILDPVKPYEYIGIYKLRRQPHNVQKSRKSAQITTYQKTFILNNDPRALKPLAVDHLRHILQHIYNLTETKNSAACPTFLYISEFENDGGYKYQSTYFNTKCYLMNLLSDEKTIITDKTFLYRAMKYQYPSKVLEYMGTSYTYPEFMTSGIVPSRQNPYIAKPAGTLGKGGKGIIMLEDIRDVRKLEQAEQNHKYADFIISEYIMNPLLFHKKKFHCRVYFIASLVNGACKTYLYPIGKILTARLAYKAKDFSNSSIHDTHFDSTDVDYMFPHDLPDFMRSKFQDITWPKICEIFECISNILKPYCKPYPNAKNAYEIFGADVMIRDDYTPVLLEVNEHIAYTTKKREKIIKLSHDIFEFLEKSVFSEAFQHNSSIMSLI